MDTTKALELADKIDLATPGKWSIPKMGNGQWIYAGKLLENDPGFIRGGNQVAVTDDSDLDRKQRKANAKAICIARNEAPVMLRAQAAQIAQLTAELELRTKERDQATRDMTIDDDEVVIRHRHGDSVTVICKKANRRELYAHLAGRGE